MEVEKLALKSGHHAYAAKQARVWTQLLEHARKELGDDGIVMVDIKDIS